MNKLKSIIDKMLELLEEYEFIEISEGNLVCQKSSISKHIKICNGKGGSDFVSASNLDVDVDDEGRIKATMIGQRVSELYLDPFTAHHLIDCLRNCNEESTVFSFLQMISNTLEMIPLLRVKSREHEEVQEKLVERYDQLLMNEPTLYDPEYDDFINSVKTALFFETWIDEQEMDFLLDKYNIRPGEIHTKLGTADWLLYSTTELAKLVGFQPILKEINKLRIRVKYGVREELLPLLKLKGIGRKRARKLYNNKIKNIKDLNNVSLTILSKLVGQKTALTVKEQIGAVEKVIPKGKRVGQLAISKFK